MKYTITYSAGCHSATETDFSTLLGVVRQEFADAIAYSAGLEAESDADLSPGAEVLIWEDRRSAMGDDGRYAIARVSVAG
jgi:hypothetical protein